jgi:hypothetical protein
MKMDKPANEIGIVLINAFSLEDLVTFYNINNWWQKFLDTPYIVRNIANKYSVHINKRTKFRDIVTALDIKDPSRLCKSMSLYECLLKSIRTKDNYLLNVLFKQSFDMYKKEFETKENPRFKDIDEFLIFLIKYAIDNNNLYAIERFGEYQSYYRTVRPDQRFFPFIDAEKYTIDIVTYLAIVYQNIDYIKAYLNGMKTHDNEFISYPIDDIVSDDYVPDNTLSKILRILFENAGELAQYKYIGQSPIFNWDKCMALLLTQDKKLSYAVLVDAKQQYENFGLKRLYYIPYYKFNNLYYDLFEFLLSESVTMVDVIKFLIYILKSGTKKEKKTIHTAVVNILTNSRKWTGPSYLDDLYFSVRGLLLLCYEPSYSSEEIIDILQNECASGRSINMAIQLINAFNNKLK